MEQDFQTLHTSQLLQNKKETVFNLLPPPKEGDLQPTSDGSRVQFVLPLESTDAINLECYHEYLSDVSNLGTLRVVSFKGCLGITDVSALKNVYALCLSGATRISSFQALKGINTLDLSFNTHLYDVYCLRYIQTLILDYCFNVTNVRALENYVYTASFRGGVLTTADDLFHLRNLYSLDISDSQQLTDLQYLQDVPHLSAANCTSLNNRSVSCSGTVTLDISSCTGITVIPNSLQYLHTVNLSNLVEIQDVSLLANLHSVTIASCPNVTDVSALGMLYYLDCTNCHGVKDVSSLGMIHTLVLAHCDSVTDVSALGNVHDLNLSYCSNINDNNGLEALQFVHTLNLAGSNVKNVSGLTCVQCLNLSETKVTSVEALRNTYHLSLAKCSYIQDLETLDNVHTLDSA